MEKKPCHTTGPPGGVSQGPSYFLIFLTPPPGNRNTASSGHPHSLRGATFTVSRVGHLTGKPMGFDPHRVHPQAVSMPEGVSPFRFPLVGWPVRGQSLVSCPAPLPPCWTRGEDWNPPPSSPNPAKPWGGGLPGRRSSQPAPK